MAKKAVRGHSRQSRKRAMKALPKKATLRIPLALARQFKRQQQRAGCVLPEQYLERLLNDAAFWDEKWSEIRRDL